jgi:hypothetical protein
MVVDGYSLAKSDDNGATFQPVMSFTQLAGLLGCAPVQTNCAAHWDRIQGVLGITRSDAGTGQTSRPSHCASAGGDAWSLLLIALWWRGRRNPRAHRSP